MSLFDALGPRVAAALSHRRREVPDELFVGEDSAERLAAHLARTIDGRRAVLLFDVRTGEAAAGPCVQALRVAGFDVREVLIPDEDGHPPACDDTAMRRLQAAMPSGDLLVGVGSGVISDLTKWLAFEASVPGAIYATAASMNGYSAANVAPAIEGVKTLIHARAHRVIAADPEVLANAPKALTSAGLGDIIAKSVSTADWKMNELLFGEDYSDAIASIIDAMESRYLGNPEGLAAGEHDAVNALFEALVFSGCAMTLQGSSMPASGGEHLISHALDMRATAQGTEHDLHGRQVGLGTVFAAALYERVLALESPTFTPTPLPLDRAGWGPIADSVAVHHAKQSAQLAAACPLLRERWDRIRAALSPMLPKAASIKDILRRAGAAHRIEDIGVDRERFLWAVRNGAQIRERFTSVDLAWATGILPDAADDIIDEYLTR